MQATSGGQLAPKPDAQNIHVDKGKEVMVSFRLRRGNDGVVIGSVKIAQRFYDVLKRICASCYYTYKDPSNDEKRVLGRNPDSASIGVTIPLAGHDSPWHLARMALWGESAISGIDAQFTKPVDNGTLKEIADRVEDWTRGFIAAYMKPFECNISINISQRAFENNDNGGKVI